MSISKAESQRRYRKRHKEMVADMNNLLLRQHKIILELLDRCDLSNVSNYLRNIPSDYSYFDSFNFSYKELSDV